MESSIFQRFSWVQLNRSFARCVAGLGLVLFCGPATAGAQPESLARARQLYNGRQYEQAVEAAARALEQPGTRQAARLLQGRAGLERFRQTAQPADLERARAALRSVDAGALDGRDRVDLLIGLAEALYLDGAHGAAADLFRSLVDAGAEVEVSSRDHLLDWWATAVDRYAQGRPPEERGAHYAAVLDTMEAEVRRDAGSVSASYWLVVAARNGGDFERAWDAAVAGWVRAQIDRGRSTRLRQDLDALMTDVLIPERAAQRVAAGLDPDRKQALAHLIGEWERVKTTWTR
jgi:hypothetical protein